MRYSRAMTFRPWPQGYDSVLKSAMEYELPALAKMFERAELETRMRWYELKDSCTRKPCRPSTPAQRRTMVNMRAAGEKLDYIAAITGFSSSTISHHTFVREPA